MIFITVGTQPQLFKRLFDEIVRLVENGTIMDDIVAQTGFNSVNSDKIKTFDFIPSQQLLEYVNKADLIVSHGGTGSIIPALKLGKKVIGIPRLSKFGEHINDHQMDLINQLSAEGFIIPIYDIKELGPKIIESINFVPKKFVSGQSEIISKISEFINNN
ncbi:PssE/Cps14G family polysaccharide biosynthesis glycosyltransferase [Muribaculum intestinale]|uniref:PssE/Cps14G family polysaccharide biosynthesis glycosyltransferase n=1 Tax=Muribaculum intestinale TaxID=1796646 RepID=UPI0026026675|nr:PssE/Cps14G family polysaccharide biosynthesis glycosyltransferase [Muribaculum intestinale]